MQGNSQGTSSAAAKTKIKINNEVLRLKKSDDWKREYMTLAMEMLHSQIDPALIAKCTKLSIDTIKELGKLHGLL